MEAGIRELKVGMGKRGMEDGEDQEVKLEAGIRKPGWRGELGMGGCFPLSGSQPLQKALLGEQRQHHMLRSLRSLKNNN